MKNGLRLGWLALSFAMFGSNGFAAAGRTPGQFTVSATGAAQYTIPLWTPPGIRALQQTLALAYRSQHGNGLVGVGWAVGGLSSIQRCNLTFAQDGGAGSPQLVTTDRLCLDGKRLRLTSTETLADYGQAGTTYQTEIADFSNITANGTAGNGPSYFIVQGKNGLTYEYGNTSDSKILAGGGAVASVRTWALDKVSDRAGNSIHYVYTNDTAHGTYRIADIEYPYVVGSTSPIYDIHFTYVARASTDTLTYYVVGYAATETQQLSEIDIKVQSSGAVVKKYALTYATGTSNRTQLHQIQECSATDCLSPTAITYQNSTIGVGAAISTGQTIPNIAGALPIDMNGDGIADLVYPNSTTNTYWVMLGSATGLGAPTNTGVSCTNYTSALPVDINNDGKTDILIPDSTNTDWLILKSNGTTFTSSSTGIAATGAGGNAWIADVDGDGRADLIYSPNPTTPGSTLQVRYNSGGVFSATATQVYQLPSDEQFARTSADGAFYPAQQIYTSQFQLADFDGDGRTDLVVKYQINAGGGVWVKGLRALISRGTSYVLAHEFGASTVGQYAPIIGDFNGDGYTDLLYGPIGGDFEVFYGTGVGLIDGGSTAIPATAAPALVLDWDGDGRADLLYWGSAGYWFYALSTGAGFATGVSTGIPTPAAATTPFYVADVTGDGLADWVFPTSTNLVKVQLHSGVVGDLGSTFTDGYGVAYTPSYIALAQAAASVYVKGSSQTFPYEDYDGSLVVVPSYTASDGIGGVYTISNYFSAAVTHLQGRGFQGFEGIRTLDTRFANTNLYDYQYYSTNFPTSGMVSEDDTTKTIAGVSTNLRIVTNGLTQLTLDSTANNQRYFPYVNLSTAKTYESGGADDGQLITTSTTNYGTADTYGNYPNVETTLTDSDTGSPYYGQQWTSTSATTFSEDHGTNWCLIMPTEQDVTNTAPGVPAITRHTGFTPDYVNCRQTQQVVESGNASYQVTDVYGYDTTFGDLLTDTKTGIGMAARVTTLTWSSTGQFIASVENPLSQTTMVNFDPVIGKLLSQTDPNGITTSWQYDASQRKNLETRADGTTTTWAYNNCATAGCVNTNNKMTVVQTQINTDSTTLRIDNTYLDAFDRTLVTSGQMLNGAYDRKEVQYDNLGNVHVELAPCTFVSCSTYTTTNTYDILNRLTQSQRPISATVSTLQYTYYAYQGRTRTITDANSHVTTQISLVTGAAGRSKDNNGYYVNFNRDAFGSVLSMTDSLSNTLSTSTFQYGIAPFRVSSTDMDLGSRSYTVDALGEVTGYMDAKGQNFSALYDALSRPTKRTEPDLTTTWTWGSTAASHNIGKLAGVSSVATGGTYSESYTYDSIGRLSNKTITLPTDGTPPFDYAYSATTGLLSTLTYPQSFPTTYRLTVGYTYQYGILQQMFDSLTPSTIWWQANAMNARGQITEETTSDLSTHPQIVSNRTYDAVTGWLGSTQTAVGGGSALQNESYLHDYVGNVTQRQNNNAGLTENFYYDNLNRLDHSTLGSTTNLQMCYDNTGAGCTPNVAGMGNISSRSDVASGAAWTYDPTHKHQVTQAGSSSNTYVYDANGNATARNGSTIGWTSYNYPAGVSTSSESATFDYGPDRQRWRMIYSGPSGNETTFYATPLFEKVYVGGGGEYRYYLYVGNRPVMVIRRNTASQVTARSLLLDHQGSIASIVTDSTGVLDVSESFTAYGNRREASTWSGAPTSAELNTMNGVTREGYTFQTVLGSMGLNHMNGRVEDAVTGRFLSADPQLPDLSTQSFNRYGYVNNNPVTLTDPTGFTPCDDGGDGCDVALNSPGDQSLDTIVVQAPALFGGVLPIGGATEGASYAYHIPSALTQTTQHTIAGQGNQIDGVEVDASAYDPGGLSGFSFAGAGSEGSAGTAGDARPQSPQPLPPCDSAGKAPSPQQYQSQGQQSAQRQAYLNSVDDGSGGPASAGLLLGFFDLLAFHRGGSLDAQAYGSSAPYANYVYGDYLSAAGYSLSTSLSGANAYAFLAASYPAKTVMSPVYPSTPASNVSNITTGFNAQQSGTLCTKP